MSNAMLVIGGALFLLSTLGYQALLRECFSMKPNVGYLFLFASQACIMFFAGLLNLLPYMAYALLGTGILLFLIFMIKDRCRMIFQRSSVNVMNLFFLLFFIGVFASLFRIRFIHYDNFSHWGVVVKYMLLSDRIPDAVTAILDYKDYPLGSASFLYYVCRILGNTQGNMLVAQALLLFACFYAIFGVIKDTRRVLLVSLLGTMCALMSYFNISIRINNLLVDFLLPVLALASISIIYQYRKTTWKAALFSAPVLALLVIVKSSGVFFAAMVFCYLLYVSLGKKKYHPSEKRGISLLTALGGILLSMSTWMVWNWHMSTELADVTSKHATRMDKTPEVMEEIISKYVYAVLDWNSLNTRGIFFLQIAVIVAVVVANGILKKRWKLWKVLLLLDVNLVLYYGGILIMFLYNMPAQEALRLAGFERYASSIVIFFIGCLSMCAIRDVERSFHIQQGKYRDYRAFKSLYTKKLYEIFTVFFIGLGSFILVSEINSMNAMQSTYDDLLPARVEGITGDNWSGVSDKRYLLYASDTDRQITDYYIHYIGRYFLFSPNVDAVDSVEAEAFRDRLETYDYLVIVESDREITQYMKKFGNQWDVRGIYDTRDIIAQ